MDTAHIPKMFWHSLSFAVVALTMGLLVFGYRSTSISIEIADAKIGLNQVVTDTGQLNSELARKAESLEKIKKSLEAEIAQLNFKLTNFNTTTSTGPERPPSFTVQQEALQEIKIPQDDFKENEKQLESIRQQVLRPANR